MFNDSSAREGRTPWRVSKMSEEQTNRKLDEVREEAQEFIHKADKVTEPKEETHEISLMDLLQVELRRHMEIALDYKKKIESAKTEYKKNYYNKKLKKNNMEALKVLTAIERVKKSKADLPPKMEADMYDLQYPNDENDKTDDED
jgi:hypothetical protein